MTKGCVVLFTGIPCSGKTTIATNVAYYLKLFNVYSLRLDGDELRKTLCKGLGFSREDRDENLRRMAFLAKSVADTGATVLCSFVSPYIEQRAMIKEIVSPNEFVEVFVDADYETCMERDVKGMYKKAVQGLIENFTGVTGEYERPECSDIVCRTWKKTETVEVSTKRVLDYMKIRKFI